MARRQVVIPWRLVDNHDISPIDRNAKRCLAAIGLASALDDLREAVVFSFFPLLLKRRGTQKELE